MATFFAPRAASHSTSRGIPSGCASRWCGVNGKLAAGHVGRGAGEGGGAAGRGPQAERRGRHRVLRLESHHQRRELPAGAHRARGDGHEQHRPPSHRGLCRADGAGHRFGGNGFGRRAERRGSFATMGELASAPAILLIGNDATEQNPLVAWQIRAAIRHHGSRLYIVDSREQALVRKARDFVQIAAGQEAAAIEKLLCRQTCPRARRVRIGPAAARVARRASRRKRSGGVFSARRFKDRRSCRCGNSRRCAPRWANARGSWRWETMRIRAARRTWACCPIACRAICRSRSAPLVNCMANSGAPSCRKGADWIRAPWWMPRWRES